MRKVLIVIACLLLTVVVFAKLYHIIFSLQRQIINPKGITVITRFNAPAGYTIIKPLPGSFGEYLQQLQLKKAGMPALNYKGNIARTDAYTAAVVNLSLGNSDLQQCADAVMRLRGEYLFHKKKYKDIAFNFTNGFKCDFVHYADGYRYQNDKWVLKAKKDYSYNNFLRYMDLVFSYAGTLSLQKELNTVTDPNNLQIGDVFIKGGSPGHCFIIMNIAVKDNKKVFLLAQSYMPAQDIQILQDEEGPWFSLTKQANIMYSDLIDGSYLKRF
ncbi:hypothetical protein EOD41_16430 [Mucilaginibacter limnophilus]|uniref:DUF4846 domain-containing protein n=1 Tax=Mucilaginibacter limnophilus TaxID=1932778 RepID=A0A437ML66_9SPHI|nr:DUF4846 domain-containing protein [Mucilaginibacter limnophilus]RVT98379.1 hypothetical protein EOD41_16430 [Mucilaginibacter limnophilus]